MSRMMDNLARMPEEEVAEKKSAPTLFVVSEEAPRSSLSAPEAGPSNRTKTFIWGISLVLCAALGFSFFQGYSGLTGMPEGLPEMPRFSGGQGVSLIREGKLREAKISLDQELAAQPGSFATRMNRAYVLKELGSLAKAEQELLALLKGAPENPVLLNNLGALYLRAGKLSDAESALRRSLAVDPQAYPARVNLAGVFERKRDWPSALKIFESLLESSEEAEAALLRERVRRLRSLSVASESRKDES